MLTLTEGWSLLIGNQICVIWEVTFLVIRASLVCRNTSPVQSCILTLPTKTVSHGLTCKRTGIRPNPPASSLTLNLFKSIHSSGISQLSLRLATSAPEYWNYWGSRQFHIFQHFRQFCSQGVFSNSLWHSKLFLWHHMCIPMYSYMYSCGPCMCIQLGMFWDFHNLTSGSVFQSINMWEYMSSQYILYFVFVLF